MKRRISILLILLMLCMAATAYADVPQISADLFSSAKQALSCLSSGEYERLVTLLPFSGVSPSAAEWQSFAEGNFTTLGGRVQSEYSVAYWTGSDWRLAVPVVAPDSSDVEALVLSSADGSTFSGYRYSKWKDIKDEYESASYVVWNQEYVESTPVITAD